MSNYYYIHKKLTRNKYTSKYLFDANNVTDPTNTYTDMAKFPKEYKDSIGRDKFILLDDYLKIEKLWPVHKFD